MATPAPAPEPPDPALPNPLDRAATLTLAALMLIAPLKLGAVIGTGGLPFFPANAMEWIFATWPPFFAPVFAGGALAMVLAAHRRRPLPPPAALALGILPPLLLTAAAAVGLIRTTEWDMALRMVWQMAGLTAVAAAVTIHLYHLPDARWLLITATVAAAVLLTHAGIEQRFWGLAQTREMLLQLYREQGQAITPDLWSRLKQNRIFGPFTYPNNYAAHMVLVIPLTLAAVRRIAGRYEPARVSRILLPSLCTVPLALVLLFSGSRAALVAIGLAVITAAILHAPDLLRAARALPRAARPVPLVIALLLPIAGYRALSHARTASSMFARFDYYRAAGTMFLQQPVTGVGGGEFFPHYMRLKPTGAEETRIPHNLFLNFLSQCGLLGGLAALLLLCQPVVLAVLVRRGAVAPVCPWLWGATLLGSLSWLYHALADFNIMIPGTFLIAGVMPLLALDLRPLHASHPVPPRIDLPCRALLAVLAAACIANIWRVPGEARFQHFANTIRDPDTSLVTLQRQARTVADAMPGSPYAWEMLGKRARWEGDHALAAKAMEEAARRAPHRAALHYHRAVALRHLGRIDQAADAAQRAVTWYPTHPDYRKLAAQLTPSEPENAP